LKSNIKVYRGVRLGKNFQIGDYSIIGIPIKNGNRTLEQTVIGDNSLIRSHTIIYSGNKIGDNFQTGHGVLVRESNEIGRNVSVGSHSIIEHHVKIGNNVRIHSGAFIPEYTVIEDNAWIGPQVTLTNAKYPASSLAKKYLSGPKIKKGAKIGGGAVLLPGVKIGKESLVGAGSVVTKDVPDRTVVAGNPAVWNNKIENLFYGKNLKAYPESINRKFK